MTLAVHACWFVALILYLAAYNAALLRDGLGFGPIEAFLRGYLLLFASMGFIVGIVETQVPARIIVMTSAITLTLAALAIRGGKNQ